MSHVSTNRNISYQLRVALVLSITCSECENCPTNMFTLANSGDMLTHVCHSGMATRRSVTARRRTTSLRRFTINNSNPSSVENVHDTNYTNNQLPMPFQLCNVINPFIYLAVKYRTAGFQSKRKCVIFWNW